MKKNRINTFYALNILTILDGEILECAGTPTTQYADLDISTEKDRNIILEDLLRLSYCTIHQKTSIRYG